MAANRKSAQQKSESTNGHTTVDNTHLAELVSAIDTPHQFPEDTPPLNPLNDAPQIDLDAYMGSEEALRRGGNLIITPTYGLIDRPPPSMYFRGHPTYERLGYVHEGTRDDVRGLWLVAPEVQPLLQHFMAKRLFVLIADDIGMFYVWALKVNKDAGRPNRFNDTAREVFEASRRSWVACWRVGDEYVPNHADDDLGTVEWPTEPFNTIITRALSGRIVDTPNHPCVKYVRGKRLS